MVLALLKQFLGGNNQEDMLCFSDAATWNVLLRSLKEFSSLFFPPLNKHSSHNRNCRKGYNEISTPSSLTACFGWLGEAKVLEYDYPYLRGGGNDIICHLTSSRHSVRCALSQCRENSSLTANRYLCPQLFRHFCLLWHWRKDKEGNGSN